MATDLLNTVPMPGRIRALPRNKAGYPRLQKPALLTPLPCGRPRTGLLALPVVPHIPVVRARPAFALASSHDQVAARVQMALRAGCASDLVGDHAVAADVFALRDHIEVAQFDAVSIPASACLNMVNRHRGRYRTVLAFPGHAMRVPRASDLAIAVRMVGTLPAKASRLRLPNRFRVVLPFLLLHRTSVPR